MFQWSSGSLLPMNVQFVAIDLAGSSTVTIAGIDRREK
jgi:hypothetical protein